MTGVEVDYCTGCHGVWLDSAEFKGITEALNGEISTKSVPEYIRASLAEAVEIFSGPEGFASEWRDFLTVVGSAASIPDFQRAPGAPRTPHENPERLAEVTRLGTPPVSGASMELSWPPGHHHIRARSRRV